MMPVLLRKCIIYTYIGMLSYTCDQMQRETTELENTARSVGLSNHPGKSKVIKVKPDSTAPIQVEGKNLEEVENFTYLGSLVDPTGGTEEDIKARIGKARGSFVLLYKIWKDRKISMRTKLRIFNTNVNLVLYYGCETWKTTVTCVKKPRTFINGCLWKILRIPRTERVRNETAWERTG